VGQSEKPCCRKAIWLLLYVSDSNVYELDTECNELSVFNSATAGRIKKNCGKFVVQAEHSADRNFRLNFN